LILFLRSGSKSRSLRQLLHVEAYVSREYKITAARNFTPAKPAHFVELAMTHRYMLAIHRLSMLAVIDIRVMQVNEIFVAIGHDYPMRRFGTGQSIAADQHQWLSTGIEQVAADPLRHCDYTLDIGVLQLRRELIVDQAA
jgi:hypothetical protein